MSQAYYKLSSVSTKDNFMGKFYDDCNNYCQKDKDVDLVYFGKDSNTCECLIQVDKESDADEIYSDVTPSYKVNPVAFWITFTIFIIFIILLIYFLIQVFFIRVKKK